MKKIGLLTSLIACFTALNAQKSTTELISSTQEHSWVKQNTPMVEKTSGPADVELLPSQPLQTIEGFGGCFNELGWTSLQVLNEKDRQSILKELFAPNFGANFTICRMPVGANDFSRDWYSYNETESDFGMKNFSIANDLQTLIPFIHAAQKQYPALKIWASPWSPPAWMKYNKHYACAVPPATLDKRFHNNLDPSKQGKEGSNMFIQEDNYFKAYALYFAKFIDAYRQQGISVSTIMPQNEFNSCQIFPSCTWTASGLATFIGKYLGPEMEKKKVEIMFGTMERPAEALVDTILNDPFAGKYIKGVGFQWAGKKAIPGIHKRYPNLKLYQSEQECGNGKNDWKYCCYTWTLMKHYITNGTSAYMYWNISLLEGGYSRWGWQQNSLITIDSTAKTFRYNHEYYLMKHLSHFVKPGARLITTNGAFDNLLAFENPDKSIIVVLQNDSETIKKVSVKLGNSVITPELQPNSFSTLVIK